MKKILYLVCATLIPLSTYGAELSSDSLAGKWTFTHMILDGETTRQVNRTMEIMPNGGIINYDTSGAEESRASYVIQPGIIIYTDQRGQQSWRVEQFDGDKLMVDHSGAEMFFDRQP